MSEVKTRTDQVRQQQSPSQPYQQSQPQSSSSGATPGPDGRYPNWGTAYVPGMLGRPGWRGQGLIDPAGLLPIKERDRLGVPRSTKSQILEEPYGMGRRWSANGRSAAVFYQLYPEHQAWQPPAALTPYPGVDDAYSVTLPDGRVLVLMRGDEDRRVVLELAGFDQTAQVALAQWMASEL